MNGAPGTERGTQLHLEALNGQTAYWQYGDPEGTPLVLVHGFRGDHHGLEGIAQALVQQAPELCVVVPDLPGFGRSAPVPQRTHDLDLYGEWLRAFVTTLMEDRRSFAVLGHSFGSLVVANSLSQGLRPARTVLINPIASPALEGPQAVMTKLAIGYYQAADLLPEAPARALLGSPVIVRVMSEFMAKTRDPQLRSWIHDQHHRYFSDFADSRTLLQAFEASVSHTVGEYAPAFHAPTLLIVGDRDDITPLEAQLQLAHRLGGAGLRIVPGVGHLVHYEAVDYAVAEMLAFLGAEATHAGATADAAGTAAKAVRA